jgi:hypothetical protein
MDYVIHTMVVGPSWESDSSRANQEIAVYMNTKSSLPFLQEHASDPNPWSVDSSGHRRSPVI